MSPLIRADDTSRSPVRTGCFTSILRSRRSPSWYGNWTVLFEDSSRRTKPHRGQCGILTERHLHLQKQQGTLRYILHPNGIKRRSFLVVTMETSRRLVGRLMVHFLLPLEQMAKSYSGRRKARRSWSATTLQILSISLGILRRTHFHSHHLMASFLSTMILFRKNTCRSFKNRFRLPLFSPDH